MAHDRQPADLVFVDAFGTGNGLAIVERALGMGLRSVLLTERIGRFAGDRDRAILDDSHERLTVVEHVDTGSSDAIEAALRRFAGDRTGIIAQADRSALATAQACAMTGHRFESPAAITACTDKSVLRRQLGRAGIRSVPWGSADDAAQLADAYRALGSERGGAVVVKPATGTASLGVRLCWSWAEVHAAAIGLLDQHRRVLVERYVAGPLVSIEVFRHHGATVVLGMSDRVLSDPPDFGELSWTFPAQVERATLDAMTSMADSALNAIGFRNGPAHVEAVLGAEGPVLIEINPRMPGRGAGRLISEHSAYDVYELTIASALARPLPEARPHRSGFSSEWVVTAATPHRPEAPEHVLDLARALPGIDSIRLIDAGATANLAYRDRYDVGEVRASGSSAAEAQMRARAGAQLLGAALTEYA